MGNFIRRGFLLGAKWRSHFLSEIQVLLDQGHEWGMCEVGLAEDSRPTFQWTPRATRGRCTGTKLVTLRAQESNRVSE